MTLLSRYILGAFSRTFLLALSAFVGIYLLVDFFEKVDDLIEMHATLLNYLLFFVYKIPLIAVQVVPLAVLLGVFMTLGGFSRSNELTAMRAGGFSLQRIALPLLACGILISVASLAANEYLIPVTTARSNDILQRQSGSDGESLGRENLWYRHGEYVVNIALALPESGQLQGITLFQLDRQSMVLMRLDAEQANYRDGNWQSEHASVIRFDPQNGELLTLRDEQSPALPLGKTPEEFRKQLRGNDEMGFTQLRRLARRMRAEGFDATRYEVDMSARLATPFASLIMAFLGIPFALQRGRGGSLAVGVAVSIGIGIGYHFVQGMLLAFGYSSVLPPLIAAWAANILFGLLGLWLLLSTRQ
ncbi:MAG: LPS export ABC transporter permease LptG [Desulfuromonas sp.]|nr:MAG: LPS export ABC transporter permease LptG [Desulfuromonas sp.]